MKLSLNKILLFVLVLSQSGIGLANSNGINLQNTGNKLIEQSKKTEPLSERIQRNAAKARKAFQAKFPNLTKWVQENPKATATIAILATISISQFIIILIQDKRIENLLKNTRETTKLCNENQKTQERTLSEVFTQQKLATEVQLNMMQEQQNYNRSLQLNLSSEK